MAYPPGMPVLLCLEHLWLNRDLRGTKQLRAVSHQRERRTPTDLGIDPGVSSEVTVARKSRLMMDEGCRRKGVSNKEKKKFYLMG